MRQDNNPGAAFHADSEEQLLNLADNLPDGMIYQVVAEGDGRRFLYISRGVENLFGVSRRAALDDAMALYRLIEPEFVPNLAMQEAAALATGSPFRIEVAVRRPDGVRRWLQLNSARRVRSDGLEVWDGIALDITDRKVAEAEQARTEHRLAVATDAAEIGIWDWDPRTNTVIYSERAKAIMGLPPDVPVTFAQLTAVTHPDDLPQTRAAARRAIDPAIRSAEVYRYRVIRANDGEVRWVLARGVATFERIDGAEVATSYVGTILDVTDDVRAEAALVESEARLRLAVDAGQMAVWEADPATGTLTRSPQLNRLFGFPPDATPSLEDLRSRYAPGERERLEREGAAMVARGDTSIQVDFRQIWPDGSEHWSLLRAAYAPASTGSGRRIIGVIMDITDRKLAEERMTLIARELQHRVKNSLAIVQTIANQSFRNKTDIAEASDAFAGRLGALASATDIITASNWAAADIGEVIAPILKPFRDAGAEAFVLDGPPVEIPSKLAITLSMALHELCTNAVKYGALSAAGGQVHLGWRVENAALVVTWRETGGPPVAAPKSKGFGTRMLERGLFAADGGTVELRFEPIGVVCVMTASL